MLPPLLPLLPCLLSFAIAGLSTTTTAEEGEACGIMVAVEEGEGGHRSKINKGEREREMTEIVSFRSSSVLSDSPSR